MILSLVIVNDFNILRAARAFRPFKTDAPLRIDPDAVLAGPVTSQRFQAIARQLPEITHIRGGIQNFQAFIGLLRKSLELADKLTIGEVFGLLVSIALDHAERYHIDA
jgi:hypothetical protein